MNDILGDRLFNLFKPNVFLNLSQSCNKNNNNTFQISNKFYLIKFNSFYIKSLFLFSKKSEDLFLFLFLITKLLTNAYAISYSSITYFIL